jgi:uncharacterized protein (TIGR02996 family)
MSSKEMLGFLRAIAEQPDDDTSRLVFADWLEEHEQAARAEFIRLQIELSRMDPTTAGFAEKTARMRRCGIFTQKGTEPYFDHVPGDRCKIAFERGFIAGLDVSRTERLDTSGLSLLPLQSLHVVGSLVEAFQTFRKLKWLRYYAAQEAKPERLLEILGPKGWFPQLETLSLPHLHRACLEAGVIPQMELPRLRNFVLSTDAFYDLGTFVENTIDEEDDYGPLRTWTGLAEYLPRNAIPNSRCPLERFVWHTDDDSDYYPEDRFWPGPSMESLLEHLKIHQLKQVEVVVDWNDHEGGGEGLDTASYERNPLELCPTLEHLTLDDLGIRLLNSESHKVKSLRIYEAYGVSAALATLLAQPVCSELESLHVEVRGYGSDRPLTLESLPFDKLRSLTGTGFSLFPNGVYPNLLSLEGSLPMVMQRRWPKLQILLASFNHLSELQVFAQSDGCPNLTTLRILPFYEGYHNAGEVDFSFLAQCPHMPFLSLIQFQGHRADRGFIVDKGRLIPVREDVLIDGLKSSAMQNIPHVF